MNIKKHLYIAYFFCINCCLFVNNLNAQLIAHLDLLSDQETYQVSLMPQISWLPPFNITNSAQLTFRVPTGGFMITNIQNINGIWQNNTHIENPIENPDYDYLSFNLASPVLDISYEVDEPVVLFTFQNGGVCTGNIVFIDNQTDPFLPPNSLAANIGNQITVLGAGPGINAYSGSLNEAGIDCPEEILDFIPQFSILNTGCGEEARANLIIENIINGTAPYNLYLNGKTTDSGQQFSNLFPGSYDLEITDATGHSTFINIEVPEIPIPQVSLGQDLEIELGETINLRPTHNLDSIFSVSWTAAEGLTCNDCLYPDASPLETISYSVILVDERGCTTTDNIKIWVKKSRKTYIPNAFSPNGDGNNDLFLIYAGDDVKEVTSLQIFDRWGGLVFERFQFSANDNTQGWNGKSRNQILSTGTYLYQAQITFIDGHQELRSGTVQLFN